MLGSLPIRTHPGPSLATPGMQGLSVSIQPLYPCSSSSNLHQVVHSVFPDFVFVFFFQKTHFYLFIFCLRLLKIELNIFFILPRPVWFFLSFFFLIELAVLSLRTRSVT